MRRAERPLLSLALLLCCALADGEVDKDAASKSLLDPSSSEDSAPSDLLQLALLRRRWCRLLFLAFAVGTGEAECQIGIVRGRMVAIGSTRSFGGEGSGERDLVLASMKGLRTRMAADMTDATLLMVNRDRRRRAIPSGRDP